MWVAPDGSTLALSGIADTGAADGVGVLAGVRGLEMPPFDLVSDEVPQQPGARYRNLKTLPREVDLPLFVRATSDTGLRTLLRTVRHALDPARGTGILQVTPQTGDARALFCRYVGPWVGDAGADVFGVTWVQFLATFRALDPFFYSLSPQVLSTAVGSAVRTFLSETDDGSDPFFPIQLGSSTVLGDISVTNAGDVEAWPIWTITGPATTIILRNLSVIPQAVLEVDTTLTTGQQVFIDTRPGFKAITGPGGVNLFSALNASSQLWSIPAGASTLRVEVSGATEDSRVDLLYTPRFLGI